MHSYKTIIFFLFMSFTSHVCAQCSQPACAQQGGIQYCDSSSGRYVCGNGEYSLYYCTRHAVMELDKGQGCCMWAGGVFKVSPDGLVICRNGSVSELCSLQHPPQKVANF